MSKYAQIKQRREHYGLLRNWYGPERAAVEISAHTPQPLALSDVVEAVCGDIRSPEVAHFIELETSWEEIIGPAMARLARPVRLQEKVLYLTFDAGYENGCTAQVLDTLKAHNVTAAFFLVGNYIQRNADLVRRMAQEGHIVGNHTMHHYDMGYKTVFWSLAYVDWNNDSQPTREQAFAKLLPRTHCGAVVLLHSTSQTNAQILDELLTCWEKEGYRFGTLTELFETA